MSDLTSSSAQSAGMNFARVSIQRPVLSWLIILSCFFGGIWGFENVGRLEDPAFTIKEAIVITPYPGASAEEVENEVSERLETVIQQMSELHEVRSESSPGISEIRVEVRDEFDSSELTQIWDNLRKRVNDAQSSLPPGAGPSFVYDDFGDVYGIFYAVTSEGYSDEEVRDFAEYLRRELLVVEGVSKIAIAGAPDERIYIEIPQENLARLGLPVSAVLATLSNENAVVNAGQTTSGKRLLQITMPQRIGDLESIENLLIAPGQAGGTLRLSDIATVIRAPIERADEYIYHNGVPAFTVGVSGLADANIVDVGKAVEARIEQLLTELPVGVEIKPIYEQHNVVEESLNGFLINLAASVAIVIGVLCVFMGWRAGIAVGAVLLLTVMGTIGFMAAFDITMQRISLGALIIAMGMLVDNAIVVTEGMQMAVQRGEERLKAAESAVSSTQWPLFGATVIGIMAFSGIGLSPDSTGEFLFSLFAVIAISLVLSWILAITIAPMIAYHLFKNEKPGKGDPYDNAFYRIYRSVLTFVLRFRWFSLAALLAITMTSYWGFGFVKQAFFPNSNTPIFYVNMSLPQGADILETDRVVTDVGRFAMLQQDAVTVDTFVGQGATRFMLTYTSEHPNAAYGQLLVRTRSLEEIPDLAEKIVGYARDNHPDLEVRSERIVFGPPAGAQLEARITGQNGDVLRQITNTIMQDLHEEGTIRDIRTDWRNRELSLQPHILEENMRTIGLTRSDLGDALSFATDGQQVGLYRDGEDLIPIIARAPEAERGHGETLADRLIWSPTQNAYVPISQIVDGFEIVARDTLIQRRNRVRTITVQANPPEGETAASAFVRFSEVVNGVDMPRGYTVQWGGEHEANLEANASLGGVLPFSLLVMVMTSILLFQSVRQPLIIWLIVPMSVIGVTIGLLVTNVAFSFTALLGLLSLSGMLIKNAIVLVDELDQRIARGDDPLDAVRMGSVSRIRPVALAAGTTILGMVPLIFDAFFQGMAVTIVSGLAFASLLTLIATPLFYALFFNVRAYSLNRDG